MSRCFGRAPGAAMLIVAVIVATIVPTWADGPVNAADPDPWLGRDKALHFGFSAGIASAGYGAVAILVEERRWRLVTGASLAITAGVGKEVADHYGQGDASYRDFAWDVVGTATGLGLAWLVDRLVERLSRPVTRRPERVSDVIAYDAWVRAAVLRRSGPIESRPLTIEDVATPSPSARQLLLRVRACGVCRTDLHIVEGDLPARRPGVVPGHQVVGEVIAVGPDQPVTAGAAFKVGQRVGVAWLHYTCGICRFCRSARENLCEAPRFTGWTDDGGFAESMVAFADFVYPLPDGFSDRDAAPLLCAGIIGHRALRLTGIADWTGARLGIYGFGAAGHVAIQLARGRGADVYVATRDRERHQALAEELGASWVGGTRERPPVPLDAAIVFAPAGDIVPAALEATDRGGTVVLGGIHMSDIPALPYQLLYQERVVRSVANNTRADGHAFLLEAARLPVRTSTQIFELGDVNEALRALKRDAIRGAAVLIP
jgi:propanol-preferring alcohol dehydrogenase